MRCAAVTLILFAVVAWDAQEVQAIKIIGAGVDVCESWRADRRIPDSANALQEGQWVLGFLSGMGELSNADPLHDVNGRTVWAWIDAYCADHPHDEIARAAEAFYTAHPR